MSSVSDNVFKNMVGYFYLEKGDPTRYEQWDEARCQRVMPEFYLAWSQSQIYARLATLAVKAAMNNLEG